eukprot:COSAG02_NODE_134_length_34593_cov_43.594886_27_plen_80_part_00
MEWHRRGRERRVWSLDGRAAAAAAGRGVGALERRARLVDALGISGRERGVGCGGSGERCRVAGAGEFWLLIVEESGAGY